MGELRKKYPVDKYTKESNGIAFFFIANSLNLKTIKKFCFVKNEKLFKYFVYFFRNHY